MVRLALVVVPLLVLAGCRMESKAFCQAHPGIDGCPGDATNGGACSGDGDCTMQGFRVCDTNLDHGTCVECTDGSRDACPATRPLCISDSCQPCTQHAQCPSHVCLPDGSCADAGQVAYVRPGGTGTTCTDAAPCGKLADGVKAKPIVKIEGAIADDKPTTIDGKAALILADPGSKLTRTTAGVILDVRNDNADVRVYDLEISGGTGAKTDAMVSLSGGATPKLTLGHVTIGSNQGIGIVATTGTLAVTRSTIIGNAGGGISVNSAQFDITNNVIVGNGVATGGASTALGAVLIISDAATRRFDFNTVTGNNAAAGNAAGVNCVVGQAAAFADDIVFDNVSGLAKLQIAGGCTWTYSDIGESGTTAVVTGTGNINADPAFMIPASDYHLKPDSPAKNAADPGATLAVDIDGNVRPQDGRSDMGADEVVVK